MIRRIRREKRITSFIFIFFLYVGPIGAESMEMLLPAVASVCVE